MLRIKFKYRDRFNYPNWSTQSCTVESLDECIRIYDLGVDCEYEIISIKECKKEDNMKDLCIKRLKSLEAKGMLHVVTEEFKEGIINFSERQTTLDGQPIGALYWCNEAGGCPQFVIDKINELNASGHMVYHVTHEFTEFGELWDFLIVTEDESKDPGFFDAEFENGIAFAYVMNVSDDYMSEFGSIIIDTALGGVIRIR